MAEQGTTGMATRYIPTMQTLVAATARAAPIVRDMSTRWTITSIIVSSGRIITATTRKRLELAATGNSKKDYLVQAWI
jgi:hypothetical protein